LKKSTVCYEILSAGPLIALIFNIKLNQVAPKENENKTIKQIK